MRSSRGDNAEGWPVRCGIVRDPVPETGARDASSPVPAVREAGKLQRPIDEWIVVEPSGSPGRRTDRRGSSGPSGAAIFWRDLFPVVCPSRAGAGPSHLTTTEHREGCRHSGCRPFLTTLMRCGTCAQVAEEERGRESLWGITRRVNQEYIFSAGAKFDKMIESPPFKRS